jgi:hypothetical protein
MGFAIALGAFFNYPPTFQAPSNTKSMAYWWLRSWLPDQPIGQSFCALPIYPLPFLALCCFFFRLLLSTGGAHYGFVLGAAVSFLALRIWIPAGYAATCCFDAHRWFVYLLVSLIFHYLQPHRYIELQIADCIRLTAKYLKLRGDLWNVDANREKSSEKQLALQVELNVIHENLRDIIFRNHSSSGSSNQNRKMLIVFVLLIEILELALSTSFNHAKLQEQFEEDPTC